MAAKTFVVGVGRIPFVRAGKRESEGIMGARAIALALADAGVGDEKVQQLTRAMVRRQHLRIALRHNPGLGSACVVSLYGRKQ